MLYVLWLKHTVDCFFNSAFTTDTSVLESMSIKYNIEVFGCK